MDCVHEPEYVANFPFSSKWIVSFGEEDKSQKKYGTIAPHQALLNGMSVWKLTVYYHFQSL